jgi:thiamine biosynthesis lipoprotein
LAASAPAGSSLDGPAVNRSGRALGSPLRLTVSGASDRDLPGLESDVDSAWAAVVEVFADVDRAMSRFREDSELISLCNRSPEPLDAPSRTLVRALSVADRAVRMTGGRFDPRIIDALERVGYAGVPYRGPKPRDAPPLDQAPTPGSSRVLLREGRRGPVALPVPLDLGGIGKGLAVRWGARQILDIVGNAAAGFLLEAGGDLVASGAAPQGGPWIVGIEDPGGGPDPLAVLQVQGWGAVATSSIRHLRWVRNGRVVHHLIDPRTGEPGGDGLQAVTVCGPDPAWSEVWSKSLFLEGAAGIAAAARRRGLAAWWATDDGRLEMTAAARLRTIWVAGEG